MTITKEQFLQDVRTEVEALKANATKEEIAKLDIEHFHPDSKQDCIYGQMTGSCESHRAKELMDSACVRVTNSTFFMGTFTFDNLATHINGEYTGQTWEGESNDERYLRKFSYISMLEMYIFLKGASPKNIIDYLKGEVETLELPLD